MPTDILLSTSLPVTLSPTATPLPPTLLHTHVTYTHSTTTLAVTVSDLSHRLLLLSTSLTPSTYTPLRASQHLRVDFPSFPSHLIALLQKPLSNNSFSLLLELPGDDDDNATHASLQIIEMTAYKAISHLELSLQHASQATLIDALAERVRSLQQVGEQLQAETDRRKGKEQEVNELQRRAAEMEVTCGRYEEERQKREDLQARLGQMDAVEKGLREEVDRLERQARMERTRVEELEGIVRGINGEREEFVRQEVERVRGEAERRLLDMREEMEGVKREMAGVEREREEWGVERGRLKEEVKVLKAKGKVKTEVIQRQEGVIGREESKVSRWERECRRLRDRLGLLQVEKEGLEGRLDGLVRKLEEREEVVKSDSRVIAYLNRELNERVLREEGERGGAGVVVS
eukprot:GFKZ01007391.1.p1 GENE.GFKZ01007391.1~~GFKZ01007391.1.p1  ORF type:complete len:404 (-),score=84.32 GFKZ01007391.1:226-1437(-)